MKKHSHHHVRKTAAGFLALSTLCTAAVPAMLTIPAGAAASKASGDLNNDGTITSADVKILQTALLGGTALTAEQFTNADVTADGTVNGLDLSRLRQMATNNDPISDAISIHLSDAGITVEGDTNGVTTVSGKTVIISASGTYVVDGTITDGQILVNIPDTAADADSVDLFLQDVTMTSSTGVPCIYGQSASKLKLTCGGTNTLTDTAAANAETSGVIYGDCDITVTKNSTGSLNITSSMNSCIRSKDDIKLNGGTIVVNTDVDDTSDADAIRANNTVEIDGASVSVESSADGIKSSKENVAILSGTVSVKAGNDAIQAATALSISGGTVVACGDRGFTLDEGGALSITGGNVLATATDYKFGMNAAGTAVTLDTSGCTQSIMQLDYAAEWKKSNTITIQKSGNNVYEMTPIKKFDYVLVSGSNLDAASTYALFTGGTQMTHDGSATGDFAMTGAITQFTGVTALSGGGTITPSDDNVATALVFSGSSVTANNAAGEAISSPSNLTISGATATITTSSEISVSGESDSGQIIVNVDKTAEPEGLVTLNLEGLTLSNSSAAPIYVEAIGDEAVISAKNGTTNTISDGTSHTDTYTDSEGNVEAVNGAIFSRDDLKLKGKGTLIVNGNTEDGIVCKNDLKLWNGSITVNAVDDGIRGNDSVRIGDPDDTDYSNLNITVNTNNGSTGGDGIKSNSTETDKGYITINGGTVNINSYSDGIQAEQAFTMNGGDLTIYTYQGSSYGGSSTSSGNPGWGGGMGNQGNTNSTDVSAKGIKAVGLYDSTGTTYQSGGNLTINGGTLNIDSSDDCLHCAGTMDLLGGTMTLASGDDGMHSDTTLNIGAPDGEYDTPCIDITKSYEGVEAVDITLNSGSVMITSSDDGYNAAGGTDGSGNTGNGGWGQGGWGGGMSSGGNQTLTINGGYTYVNAGGDGLDSNGTLTVNGGYVFVSQTGGGNSPIDCDTTWNYNGGIVIAGGNSDMFHESIPASYSFLTTTSIQAGTAVTFTDSNGTVLATMTFANASAEMVMCAPDSSVTCYTGGTVSGATYFATSTANTNMKAGWGGTISGGTTVSQSSGGNQGGWGGF